ncbi:MAG: diguanylate cyclase [Geobacter sp.]|nr:diguanylate cyclase [Geobacter sp.]
MTTQPRILLAEDEKIAADYLTQSLHRMGYEVTNVVQTGEEAIERADEDKPDLVLMDITLGGKINGIAAAQTLHGQTDIPIIYLTADTNDHIFELAKLTEPYAYLVKPYELSQLKHAIELALFKHGFEKRIKESENRYRTIFEASDNAMMVIDMDGMISMVNEEFEHLCGCSKASVEKLQSWVEFFDADEREKIQECLSQAFCDTCNIRRHFEAILSDKSGDTKTVYVNIKKFPGTNTCILSMSDISELKTAENKILHLNNELNEAITELKQEIVLREQVEKQLRHKVSHDYLTGLPNRVLLFDRLKQLLAFEARHNTLLAVMIIDLDNFKTINDTMGHLAGDVLLKKVAQELQKCMRQYDTVGRIGGDEFVIIVNDVKSIQDIITFAEKIRSTFQKPFDIVGQKTFITTSIGVAVYPLHGSSIETLLKKADMAMYAAKRDGRNTFRFFYDAMDFKGKDPSVMKVNRRATQGLDIPYRQFLSDDKAKLKEH